MIEMQAKIHKYCDGQKEEKEWSRDFDETKHMIDTITLNPGDSLYFPAGMWHQVECEEDSVSINLSIKAMRYCDLVSSAIRQIMIQDESWRREICEDTTAELNGMLQQLVRDVKKNITSRTLLPNQLRNKNGGMKPLDSEYDRYRTRVLYFDEDLKEISRGPEVHSSCSSSSSSSTCSSSDNLMHSVKTQKEWIGLVKNPLAILIRGDEIEHRIETIGQFEYEWLMEKCQNISKSSSGSVFVLNLNFGSEDLESVHRTILVDRTTDQRYSNIVVGLMKSFNVSGEKPGLISKTEFIKGNETLKKTLGVLHYCGYVVLATTTG